VIESLTSTTKDLLTGQIASLDQEERPFIRLKDPDCGALKDHGARRFKSSPLQQRVCGFEPSRPFDFT